MLQTTQQLEKAKLATAQRRKGLSDHRCKVEKSLERVPWCDAMIHSLFILLYHLSPGPLLALAPLATVDTIPCLLAMSEYRPLSRARMCRCVCCRRLPLCANLQPSSSISRQRQNQRLENLQVELRNGPEGFYCSTARYCLSTVCTIRRGREVCAVVFFIQRVFPLIDASMRTVISTFKKIMAQGTRPQYSAWFVAGSGLCVGLGFLAKRALSRKKGYGDVVETPTSNPGWSPPSKQAAPEKGAFSPTVVQCWVSGTGVILLFPANSSHLCRTNLRKFSNPRK